MRELAPEIAWRQIIGTRNGLAHAYLGIEPDTVWLIISDCADLAGATSGDVDRLPCGVAASGSNSALSRYTMQEAPAALCQCTPPRGTLGHQLKRSARGCR
jgi:hypothetical protein